MARVKNFLQMTGSLDKLSMYTLQGHDQVIIRTKGGPNKYQVETKPQFEQVRRNNAEWKGCTRMGRQIRGAFQVMNSLEDYPVSGALNAICKQIQKMDTESEHGKRALLLSKNKEMLLGFSFSRKQVLESVVRVPIESAIDRASGKAQITIPAVNTALYLYNFQKLPYFRIKACLSGVRDMQFHDYEHRFGALNYYVREKGIYESEWLPASGTQPAMQILLEYPIEEENTASEKKITDDITLILTLGIEFGKVGYGNITEPVKYAGTGKVIRVR
jgi:hypothetical protein